jgi:hypothetical protein
MRLGGSVACALGLLLSCAGARPPEAGAPASPLSLPSAPAPAVSPRLFPPTQGAGVLEAGVERDGSRRLLAFGLRVVQRTDGSLEVGDEVLPAARSARFTELPPRLGSGFLFWIISSSGTLVYRAATWTAKLEPLAQLDFEAERFVPAFDRLLVLPKRDSEYRALDALTGEPVPPIGLPPAPAYGALAFMDGWFGAAQVPLRGTLLSFDAGASWHPLGMPVVALEEAGDSLALSTPSEDYLLDARGQLSHVADRDAQKISEAARAELQRAISPPAAGGKSSDSPLELAVLSGYPDGAGHALVAAGGALLRVSLRTGRVVERRERAYASSAECQGVRLGSGVGFVCGQGSELTRVYRATTPFGLSLVRELSGARAVTDGGSGSLVVHGGCEGVPSPRRHCVLRADGSSLEVTSRGERDRVVALADGRVAVVTPPTSGGAGSLALFRGGAVRHVALSLAGAKRPRHRALLEQGVWLDGMVELRPGVLSGWVVGAGPFVGVELAVDGKLTLGRIQDNAGRVLFAGKRALSLGENGLASETTDGGAEWQAVELPSETDLRAAATQGLRQGCSAVGCSFAGFVRMGWFDGRPARSLAMPATPSRVTFPGPGGSRWRLHCDPTGDASDRALPTRLPSAPGRRSKMMRGGPGEETVLAPLAPFLEQPPPPLPDSFEGVSAGTEPNGVQLRVYAYGPRGGDWTRAGSLSIAFADRFATKNGVKQSALARSPWPDAATAADALGAEPSTNSAGLAASLDPGGNAGALLLNSRGTLDLFVFEPGRVPLRLTNVGRLGVAPRLSGFVKAKGGFFFGSYDDAARSFRVYRVAGQDLDVALEVTDIPPSRGASAELTRTASGDALGIWIRGTGWFMHPVDLETSSVDAPYVVPPSQLASMPKPCADGEEGFLATGPIGLDPSAESPGFALRSFEGRFRVSALGVCIDALAVQGEAESTKSPVPVVRPRVAATGRPTVSATLTERKPLGRRVELRCSN